MSKKLMDRTAVALCILLLTLDIPFHTATKASVDYGWMPMPPGLVVMITTGICPVGFNEATSLDGQMLQGTLHAHADVGTTGGSNSITPTGNVGALTFTGSSANTSAITAGTPSGNNAWPVGVPALTMNSYTPAGTNGAKSVATTSGSFKGTSSGGFSQIGGVGPGSSFSVAGQTFTGTPATLTGTLAWPAGVPAFSGDALATHFHTLTATGTINTPAFTGNSFDPHPGFTRVIFCTKI